MMIFELSETFGDVAIESFDDRWKLVVERLVEAHRDGRHLFTAHPELLQNLKSASWLSETQRATVGDIVDGYAYLGGFVRDAQFTTLVVPGDITRFEAEEENQEKLLNIYDLAAAGGIGDGVLLVEDDRYDGEMILLLCDLFEKELGVSVRNGLTIRNGGGSGIGHRYSLYAGACVPLICLVDSDKKYPGDTEGTTAKSLKKWANRVGHSSSATPERLSEWYVLDVHEMENLIPLDVLGALGGEPYSVVARSIERVQDVGSRSGVECLKDVQRYLDFKNGLPKGWANANPESRANFAIAIWKVLEPKAKPEHSIGRESEKIIGGCGEGLIAATCQWAKKSKNFKTFRKALKMSGLFLEVWWYLERIASFAAADIWVTRRIRMVH